MLFKKIFSQKKDILHSKNVQYSKCEGECHIKSVCFIQFSTVKIFITKILGILSIGLLLFLCHWIPSMKKRFYYTESQIKESTHFYIQNMDDSHDIVVKQVFKIQIKQENKMGLIQVIGFEHQYLRYYYDSSIDQFRCYELDPQVLLDRQNINDETQILGHSAIEIPIPGYCQLFLDEILDPYFIFQLYSISLWIYYQYYLYSSSVFLVSFISSISNLIMVRNNWIKIKDMATIKQKVTSLKSGKHIDIDSNDILPGDIIQLKDNMLIPTDCILLNGSVIVNESSLTGESVQILKQKFMDQIYNEEKHRRSTLYCGTTILLAHSEDNIEALVIRTSFSTLRGRLIRSILFEKQHNFNFFKESIKFQGIIFFLTSIAYLFLIPILSKIQPYWILILNFMNLVSTSVPAQVTATLQVGQSFALQRLEKVDISCISPGKVIIGGRVQTVCFDKTGTLTEDGMTLNSLLIIESDSQTRLIQKSDIKSLKNDQNIEQLLNCMAICHSLIKINQQILGDPMEIELFSASQCKDDIFPIKQGKIVQIGEQTSILKILKFFEFSSESQCMSVLVQDQTNNDIFLFCKGAPEKLFSKSNNEDINKLILQYSQIGYRVLMLAFKKVDIDYQSQEREDLEKDFIPLAIALFENPLKNGSKESINQLKLAEIRCLMITGDNLSTACEIARQTNIVERSSQLLILNLNSNDELCFENLVQNQSFQLQNPELVQDENHSLLGQYFFEKEITSQALYNEYSFAMTGVVFTKLYDYIKIQKCIPDPIQVLLKRCCVFARMKANQKTQLIEIFQQMHLCIAMVGDGSNDIGALRRADIGLSLSKTEASISAPFTSKNLNINSIVELLIQSRAGLATTYQTFKFLALNSVIQFITCYTLYFYLTMPSDFQFLYWDLFICSSLSVTINMAKTPDKLSIQIPSFSLFTLRNFLSVFGQIAIIALAHCYILKQLSRQIFYEPVDLSNQTEELYDNKYGDLPDDTYETSTIFILANLLYVVSPISIYIGMPFKEPFYKNKWFTINTFIFIVHTLLLCFFQELRLPIYQFHEHLKQEWLQQVYLESIFWCFVIIVYEYYICDALMILLNKSNCQKQKQKKN